MGLLRRVLNLWRRECIDAEIDEELQSHLAMAAEDAQRAGMSAEEARRVARLRFGNALTIRERTAESDTAQLLDGIARDLRHALRQLRRSWTFTATVVVTLALGIGATTAVFTLVQQVMMRSLPVAHPEELWRIGDAVRCCHATGYAQNDWNLFSWELYQRFRDNTPAFEKLAALQVGQAELAVRRSGSSMPAAPYNGEYVSGNFFETFGASAWRGRMFTDVDDREGQPAVAVMSFRTWDEQYASDPSVIGATYEINGHPFTIVGVAAPGFFGAKTADSGMPDFWLPLTTEPLIDGAATRLENPGLGWLDLIGRVRPGINMRTLNAELRGELRQWLVSHAADMTVQERSLVEKQTLRLAPGASGVSLMREDYKDGLGLLLLAAVCVLLVACANIANLLLARGLKDRQQTALRAALGASRAQLMRKALAESVTLSVLGAVAGVAVAYGGARLILYLAFGASGAWVPVDAAPSTALLLFALVLAVTSGIAFGIAPAWMTSRADPIAALHGANRTVGASRHWAQRILVIVQAALSLVLLSSAAMLGKSLRNLEHQHFGFDTDGRYLVSINSMISNYAPEQLVPLFRATEERLRAVPGVRSASAALYSPMSGYYWDRDIRVEGKVEQNVREDVSSAWTRVSPGFFETLGDRIVMGRAIGEEDNAAMRPVAVINETFAKRFFGKSNPIGQHFGLAAERRSATYEIVGVAKDMRYFASMRDRETPMYFVPEAQTLHVDDAELASREAWSHYFYNIVIWAPRHPVNFERQVRGALADVDPNLVMYSVRSYSDVIHADFAQQNMIASLTWLFGATGLALAAVGLYGVTAYGVEQRTGEIGVRMALGANRGAMLIMVVRGALLQAGIGLTIGMPMAVGAGYLIASQLFGVTPWDWPMMVGAALMQMVAASIAAFIPARRAASVSPMEALRAN